MPDVPDSPDGVHTHVRIHTTDHPDGNIMLWVKSKFHVMFAPEARALAKALNHFADLTETAPAPAAAVMKPASTTAPAAEEEHDGLFVG